MQKFRFLFLILLLSAQVKAQQPVLVSPQWVYEHREDSNQVILYTGFVIRDDYNKEHIEGSRFLWPEWLAFNKPEGNMFAPDRKTATRILQDLGINQGSRIVICHRGADVTIAARMFMTLEHFGLKGKVSFLNGGLEAWKKAGYPVTDKPAVFKKGNIELKEESALVDKQYVFNALSNADKVVVDARMKRWYDGDPTGNPRDGHITGSLNIPYPDMIDSTNSFKPVSVLEKNFTSIVPDRNKEVVLYCFIGQTACVDYVVGRNLGYNMKVYEGSMQEWSRDAKMPMEKTKRD
ncbi:MAG TPA: rhodanese-like domain-containing protein [Chitinophagaceae bacterium]|jgi:thiosulfate/3-mercaptopyruvate sulfurtransferase|nr:rhodanese-like domain-containing protein [Chitinophagaceae bacterium]